MNTVRVSNSLDPVQARHFVRPELGPNSLQNLSAVDNSRQKVKYIFHFTFHQEHLKRMNINHDCKHRWENQFYLKHPMIIQFYL